MEPKQTTSQWDLWVDIAVMIWQVVFGVFLAFVPPALIVWIMASMLTGCSHDNAIAFKVYDQREEPSRKELKEACDLWGLECYKVTGDDDRGVVTLILSDGMWDLEDGRKAEGVILRRGCSPIILAVGDAGAIAHELGHALGLLDEDDEDNVMADGSGPIANKKQKKTVQTFADWQAICVGGMKP